MAFWGIEVKPGKPYTHRFDEERGRLHLSQATLGNGSSTKKSILQCKTGEKEPIYLCSLLPDKIESCALNLEFEEEDEVIFSVQGPQSIFISGFFVGESEDAIRDAMRDAYESDSYGEDISGTESDDASDYDSEEGFVGDFLDDGMDMYVPKSGVVIEEILDDDKRATSNGSSKSGKKKKQSSASANSNSETQLVVKSSNGNQVLESEDEDGFPILTDDKIKADASSIKQIPNKVKDKRSGEEAKKKQAKDEASVRSLKRKFDSMVEEEEDKSETGQQPGSSPVDTVVSETDPKHKEKKKKKKKVNDKEEAVQVGNKGHQKQSTEKNSEVDTTSTKEEKKKNKQEIDADATVDDSLANKKESPLEKTKGKSAQVRTFPNGLVVEEVVMGRPNGKKASPGKKVSVHYIGKLKKNGAIFDSNVGRAPFKFRLGVGEVIKGWDVGVNGMRVGDKRRFTIPPVMGYGAKGAGKQIPPNSWLVFDVELVAVN